MSTAPEMSSLTAGFPDDDIDDPAVARRTPFTCDIENGEVAVTASVTQQQSGESRSRNTRLLRGAPGSHMHSHRIPASQYVALGVWLSLLCATYGVVRGACRLHIPEDCTPDTDIVRVLDDYEFLLLAGFVLAVMTGMHWPDRFLYVFSFDRKHPRGVLFLVALFGSAAGWGLLDRVPLFTGLSFTGFQAKYLPVYVLLVSGATVLVGTHFWFAYKYNSWAGFWAYILSRCSLLALYSAYIVAKLQPEGTSDMVLHFHHYVIGMLVASLAEFNHPVSVLLLACGTGVFVQGIAAYNADPILRRDDEDINRRITGCRDPQLGPVTSPWMPSKAADWVVRYMRCSMGD